MPTYKTPDVYVEELSVFPPSVAEVGTAIPAFIGHTEKAIRKTEDLSGKPTKIFSLKEFEDYFGFPRADDINISVDDDGAGGFKVTAFADPTITYLLYYAVKMYFDNGGAQCYIVSVGTYADAIALTAANNTKGLQVGLDRVAQEDEPTLLVIPEAVKLSATDFGTLAQAVLKQCGDLKDRFGIFDIHDGETRLTPTTLATNRKHFGTSDKLKYGA